jgi:hypothetical protein
VLKRIIALRSDNIEIKRRLRHKWKINIKAGLENWM